MRAYISARYFTHENRIMLERLCSTIESLGVKTFLLPRDEGSWFVKKLSDAELVQKKKEEIEKSDFLIVDFSDGEIGAGSEIGQAFFLGKPIVIITNKGKVSQTMEKMAEHTIQYLSLNDLKEKLRPVVEKIRIGK